MYALVLAVAVMTPAEFRFNISHPVAPDAVILLELPVPETGKKFKRITVDHFKKHGPLLMYLEYQLTEVKLEGLIIKRAVFRLPKPPTRTDDVSTRVTTCRCNQQPVLETSP